jgi:hypothetical protein
MCKPRPTLFKWRHFEPPIIVCAVRWYLRYSLSYRDVEELVTERGLPVATPPFGVECSCTLPTGNSELLEIMGFACLAATLFRYVSCQLCPPFFGLPSRRIRKLDPWFAARRPQVEARR